MVTLQIGGRPFNWQWLFDLRGQAAYEPWVLDQDVFVMLTFFEADIDELFWDVHFASHKNMLEQFLKGPNTALLNPLVISKH